MLKYKAALPGSPKADMQRGKNFLARLWDLRALHWLAISIRESLPTGLLKNVST
jgi:hypothetical protein